MKKASVQDKHGIQQTAEDYRSRGYKVLVEPTAADIPSFLENFRPDMIAHGPEDSVVVVVKAGTRTAASERFKELADAIRQQDGWRFSLVVVDPRSDDIAPSAQQLLTRDQIAERLKNGEELLHQGAKEVSFVMLWTSTEALLRQIASREGLPLQRLPSSALLRELFLLGILSRNDFDTTLRALAIRNSLVHGFDALELGEIFLELTPLATRLLAELDQAEAAPR
ncbi:MAG: hypothetical protein OXP66_09855 [Candidatus Tectomicrobia bacterium]|nr:hypothetical protein [Candidatus Tectomicrobia bacterium]